MRYYQEKVEQVDNTKLIEAKELAVAYNQTILPGAQDEDSFSKEALLSASENYGSLLNLAGDGIMGYVEIPTIGVTLPIYEMLGRCIIALKKHDLRPFPLMNCLSS